MTPECWRCGRYQSTCALCGMMGKPALRSRFWRSRWWQFFWMVAIGYVFARVLHLPNIPSEDGLVDAIVVFAGVCVGGIGWMAYREWRD